MVVNIFEASTWHVSVVTFIEIVVIVVIREIVEIITSLHGSVVVSGNYFQFLFWWLGGGNFEMQLATDIFKMRGAALV